MTGITLRFSLEYFSGMEALNSRFPSQVLNAIFSLDQSGSLQIRRIQKDEDNSGREFATLWLMIKEQLDNIMLYITLRRV